MKEGVPVGCTPPGRARQRRTDLASVSRGRTGVDVQPRCQPARTCL